ncbi:polynucleotidyl transferase Ribonuclease H fold, partial [Trifolium medium]|nr:polynucleotidyl transferase Ribonuclease H fold [Trifolium medium]
MPPRVQPVVPIPIHNNTDSVFYVHPSEGPNTVLTTPLLNGSNYLAWSRSMRRALGAKNKIAFVDGSIPIPDLLDLNRSAWERCNNLVHSWIINSVSESIAQTLVFHENAIDAWEDLHERFAKADRIHIISLRYALNNLKQGNRSVLDYYTDMRALWEELNSHRPMPHCTCVHQCRCEAMRAARLYRLEDQIIQFLTGLNDKFSVVRTQVLLMDPLPSINKVYSLVTQEESNHAFLNPVIDPVTDDSNVLVNASDSKRPHNRGKFPANSGRGKNDTRHCTFCDKSGYTVDWCYKKHGNPNIRANSGVNAANSDTIGSSAANGNAEMVTSGSSSTISQDKYDQLVSLLHEANLIPSASPLASSSSNHIHSIPSPESGCISHLSSLSHISSIVSCSMQTDSSHWIADSGANDHICSSVHWFNSFYKIKPISVNLPNGNSVIVKYAGNVQFTPHLYLKHDMKSKRMIGLGDQVDGLYRLMVNGVHPTSPALPISSSISSLHSANKCTTDVACNSSCVTATFTIPAHALWHFRLGHLSHKRLSHMKSLVTTPLLNNNSPYHLLHDSIPDASQFKVFGSLCFASTLTSQRSKLDVRARKSVFLGYKSGYKGFVLYDLHTREIFVSRHVHFHEHILPYLNQPSSLSTNWDYIPSIPDPVSPSTCPNPIDPTLSDSSPLITSPSNPPLDTNLQSTPPRCSTRPKHTPPYLKDYVYNAIDHPAMSSSSTTPYPMSSFLSYHHLSLPHCHFALSLTTHVEPKSYAEAVKFECWRQAMQVELQALENTGTWYLVDLPSNAKPIGCRWVYKIKHHANGTVERYKA